jgi:hypothetical protein
MQNVEGKVVTYLHYCHTICVAWLPDKVIRTDEDLCRLVKRGGKCFARIVSQASRNTLWLRIAADPRHLRNEKRSRLVEVPTSALTTDIGTVALMAAAIPPLLLEEDVELWHAIETNGMCPAFVEQQLSWDLYRVRIAPDIPCLIDKDRSHEIFLSQAELLTYMKEPSDEERPYECSTVVVRPEPQKPVGLTSLESVQISEEDLKTAAGTVDIPEEAPLVQARRHDFKSWHRWKQNLELILYRAVLRALSHKKALQEIIRRVLVMRKRFSRRLISINDIYEKDSHTYWIIRVEVPTSLI